MIGWALLQMGCYTEPDADLLECSLGDLAGATGTPEVFGLLVGAALLLSFYVASNGKMATTSVLTTLIGGVLIPTLPAQYTGTAQVVMFLGIVAAILAAFAKYTDASP